MPLFRHNPLAAHRAPRPVTLSRRMLAGILLITAGAGIFTGSQIERATAPSAPASVVLTPSQAASWASGTRATLPACKTEDSPGPCLWDAVAHGNRQGQSLINGMSWVTFTAWCRAAGKGVCDTMPAGVRDAYHLGGRPGRIIAPGGDTAYLITDGPLPGHPYVLDES